MKKIIIFAAVVFGVGLAACSDDNGGGSDSNEPVRISLNGPEKRVSRAAQDLAVRTFAEIYDDDVNVAFSPLSAQIALAMAANGATEETLEEMLEQLCSGGDVEHLNSLYGKLCAGLPLLDAKSTVYIANSFWHSDGFEVLPSFCMSLSENYTAPTASYDISSPAAAAELVNKWIEKSTKGKISNIIGANDVKAYMIVNALYFKSQWCEKFDKDKTRPDKFTNSDGSVSDVQFMNGVVEDTYMEIDGIELADLHFGNKAYYFTVIKPEENQSPCEALKKAMTLISTPGYIPEVGGRYSIHVKMPKFSVRYKTDLKDAFLRLGFESVFDPSAARMDKLSPQGAYIAKVLHECRVDVDEDGAEAIASTVVIGGDLSLGIGGEAYITLDRPFAYMIRESSTGTILFMGAVNRL